MTSLLDERQFAVSCRWAKLAIYHGPLLALQPFNDVLFNQPKPKQSMSQWIVAEINKNDQPIDRLLRWRLSRQKKRIIFTDKKTCSSFRFPPLRRRCRPSKSRGRVPVFTSRRRVPTWATCWPGSTARRSSSSRSNSSNSNNNSNNNSNSRDCCRRRRRSTFWWCPVRRRRTATRRWRRPTRTAPSPDPKVSPPNVSVFLFFFFLRVLTLSFPPTSFIWPSMWRPATDALLSFVFCAQWRKWTTTTTTWMPSVTTTAAARGATARRRRCRPRPAAPKSSKTVRIDSSLYFSLFYSTLKPS